MEGCHCCHPRAISWIKGYSSVVCHINRNFSVSKQVLYWGKGIHFNFRICLLSTEVRHNNLEILFVCVIGSVYEAVLVHKENSQVVSSCCGTTYKSAEPSCKVCLVVKKQRGF